MKYYFNFDSDKKKELNAFSTLCIFCTNKIFFGFTQKFRQLMLKSDNDGFAC